MSRRAAALAIWLASSAAAPGQAPRFIPLLEPGDVVPPLPLVAQDGRRFTLGDLRGRALLVSFVYTRCADPRMCPLVSAKFARIAQRIGARPIRLVLITLDPAHDTPPILRRYGAAFGQDPRRWTLATGSPATIDELAGRLGIATAHSAPGAIVHTEAAVVIGPDGSIVQTIPGNAWSPDELLAAATAALPGGSDRFRELRGWLSAAFARCGAGGAALGGSAMLAILGAALITVGGAFWLAFRAGPVPR